MNNLFTTLVTGLALFFSTSIQANLSFFGSSNANSDKKTTLNEGVDLMDDFTVSVPIVTANVGDQVCLDVTVENFDNILSFQYSMNFDPNVLAFDTIIDPENIPDLNFGITQVANGDVSINWLDEDVEGKDFPDGTLMYQICFTVLTADDGFVNFSGMPTVVEIVDGNEDIVGFIFNNGGINTSGNTGGGGGSTDFTVSVETEGGEVGDQVCLDITVENFTNILSFQYSMNFDANLLEFDTIIDPENIPDLNFGLSQTDMGNISVNWLDEDVTGLTFPDGTVMYQVCFTILGGNGGVVPVSFSGNPTTIEVVDGNEDPVSFASNSGGVNVGGASPVGFNVSSASGDTGDNVCLNVTTNNFNDIASFNFDLDFNATVIAFDQIMDPNALSGISFDETNAGSGTIGVTWNNSGTGVNLNNGTTVFQICFDLVGNGGTSSSVSLSGNPGATDGSGDMVNVIANNGSVSINTVNNGTDFTVIANTPVGEVGEVVCIDVTVENFDNILSFQYSMNWDAALLEFVEVIDPENIPDLNFGDTDVSNGNLSVNWLDEDVTGVSFPDGTVMYQVCFTILGGDGTTVPFSFSGNPTVIEVVDGNEDPVVFNSQTGGVNVGGTGSTPVSFSVSSSSGENGDNVCLDVSVSNFNNIAAFSYDLNFNASVLSFTQNMDAGALSGINFDNSSAGSGNLSISWNNSGTGVNLSNGTVLYQVCFDLVGSGGSSSAVSFANTSATDGDGGSVNLNGNNGNVSINSTNNGTDFIVTASDAQGDPGETVCVDVTVENFNNILSFQFSMNFDPTILQFDEIVDPENIDGLNFGINQAANGDISVNWLDEDVTGLTFPDGTVMFQVCFTVLDGTETTIDFSGNPTVVEVVDGNEDPVVFGSNSGTINGTVVIPELAFSAPTQTVDMGDNFCVDITTSNFTEITSFQYNINFDPSVIAFNQANLSGALAGISVNTANAGSGSLSVTWSGSATTLSNGTDLFELCFSAVGDPGESSSLNINGSSAGNGGGPVNVIENDGQINVMQVINNDGFTVIGSDEEYAPGATNVCIDVTAVGFDNILSFQFSLNFDETALAFNQIIDPENIDGLNFGVSQANSGDLSVNWLDEDVSGLTFPDGILLFQVCFDILAPENCNLAYDLSFSGNPTVIEIVDGNEDPVDFFSVPGSITVCPNQCDGDISLMTETVTNVSPCAGDTNGMIEITEVGGFDNSYSWTNAAGNVVSTNQDLTGVGAGVYTLNISGCNGTETFTQQFTITEPIPVSVVVDAVNDVDCFGDATGVIATTASGGNGGYIYTWSPAVAVGDDPSALPAGDYFVTVTDDEGCSTTAGPIVVEQPNAELTATVVIANPACVGEGGEVTINATGGTPPYMYVLENPPAQMSNVFSNVQPGTYDVSVFDVNGCSFDIENIQVQEASPITITEDNLSNDTDNCNGSINLTVAGGNPGGFTYAWTLDGSTFSATTEDISGLCAGEYCVTATNNVGGCTATYCATIEAPLTVVLVSSQGACFEECNGQAVLDITGGDGAYMIDWSDGQSIFNPTDLCSAIHTVTVTSGDGQMTTLEVEIAAPTSQIVINNPDLTNPTNAVDCDGAISILPVGGYGAPYTVTWSPPQPASPTIDNLCAGTYTAVVTDNNGCTITDEYTLISPELEIANEANVSALCFGDENGEISFEILGGAPPYIVTIMGGNSAGATPAINNNIYTYSGLAAAVYLVTVTDNAGGSETTTIEVQSPDQIFTEVQKIVDATAIATTAGSIQITQPTGGTPPYSFVWSNGSTAMNPSGLAEGCYSLTITDAANCFQIFPDLACVQTFEITNETLVSPPCSGNPDGSISVTVNGSNQPFLYEWTDDEGNTLGSNAPSLTNIEAGTYNLSVTDSCGMTIIQPFVLLAESDLEIEIEPTFFNGFNVLCNGDQNASAMVNIIAGTAPYDYDWSDGSNNGTLSNVGAGIYSVIVTDAAGCTAEESVDLIQPDPIIVSFEIDSITCNGADDGFITAEVSGGVGTGGYDYDWNNGQDDNTIGPLVPGNYSLEVTDANQCTVENTVPLPEPEDLELAFETTSVTDTELGTIQLFPTGGTAPYFYTWPVGIEGEDFVEDLNFGTYAVIVTDANGCTEMNEGIRVELKANCATADAAPVFTPNGDCNNDVWRVECASSMSNLEIYNRWGQLVFSAAEVEEIDDCSIEVEGGVPVWDGRTRRGKELPEGTYFYVYNITYDDVNGTPTTDRIEGHTTLLRN